MNSDDAEKILEYSDSVLAATALAGEGVKPIIPLWFESGLAEGISVILPPC